MQRVIDKFINYLFVFFWALMFCAMAPGLVCNSMLSVVSYCICMFVNIYTNEATSTYSIKQHHTGHYSRIFHWWGI